MLTRCFSLTHTMESSPISSQSFLLTSPHQAEAGGFTSPEQCEEHEESLSMFCLDDLEPLCEHCAAVSHAGHRVYQLAEAASDCKEELRASLNGLKRKMIELEEVTQTCEHISRHNQVEAKVAEQHIKEEFKMLHQFLKEEETAKLLALREEQQDKSREAEEQIDRMNQLIKSLEEKIHLVEEELDAGGDGAGFLELYQDTIHNTCSGHLEPPQVSRPLIDVAKHLGNLQYTEWEKMKHIAPYTPVTLDPRTAGQSLKVSPALNSAHFTPGPSQSQDVPVPANPERFHPYSSSLASEGFDSGQHCWDIEVGDSDNWTVGVAAQSVRRRTEFEACPEAGLWCISQREGEQRAMTTPTQTLNSQHLSRISVKLDWDDGMLEFTNTNTGMHLFTFRHRFTEKVYPYFESISLCGGFAVLAQNVKVSVGSHYVPLEDTDIINTASTYSCLTEDKNLLVCSVREEEEKNKPQRCTMKEQLIKSKPGEETTKDNIPAVRKQNCKPRFSMSYHVSLSRAHQQ